MLRINIDNINTGDILFVDSKNFTARVIKFFQNMLFIKGHDFNHAGIFIRFDKYLYVSEANSPRLEITPIEQYINSNKKLIVAKPNLAYNVPQKKKMLNYINSRSGKSRYAYVTLVIFQIIRIVSLKVFGWDIWLGNKTEKKFICGEWVARVINVTKPSMFKDWDRMTPVELFNNKFYKRKYKLEI